MRILIASILLLFVSVAVQAQSNSQVVSMLVCDEHEDAKLVVDTDIAGGVDKVLPLFTQLISEQKCSMVRVAIPIIGNIRHLSYFVQVESRVLGVLPVIMNGGKQVHGVIEMRVSEITPKPAKGIAI